MTIQEVILAADGAPLCRESWGRNGYWQILKGKVRSFWKTDEPIENFTPSQESLLTTDWRVR